MINQSEVVAVLTANGFRTQQESWKGAYDAVMEAGAGYTGDGEYANVDSLLDDMINGGSIKVPASVSKETVDAFALAASHLAQYAVVAASSRDWGDGVHVVWSIEE